MYIALFERFQISVTFVNGDEENDWDNTSFSCVASYVVLSWPDGMWFHRDQMMSWWQYCISFKNIYMYVWYTNYKCPCRFNTFFLIICIRCIISVNTEPFLKRIYNWWIDFRFIIQIYWTWKNYRFSGFNVIVLVLVTTQTVCEGQSHRI